MYHQQYNCIAEKQGASTKLADAPSVRLSDQLNVHIRNCSPFHIAPDLRRAKSQLAARREAKLPQWNILRCARHECHMKFTFKEHENTWWQTWKEEVKEHWHTNCRPEIQRQSMGDKNREHHRRSTARTKAKQQKEKDEAIRAQQKHDRKRKQSVRNPRAESATEVSVVCKSESSLRKFRLTG